MGSILEKYYRQPEIYITLPNGGDYYPEGTLEMTETGEIPVYAMTAKDDIILKTPDALISGEAMVELIKSCIPAIKDPWQMPASDVDFLMVAIRIASYGNEMTLDYKCQSCEGEFDFNVNLDYYMSQFSSKKIDKNNMVVKYGKDVEVHVKPLSYTDLSLLQRRTFEEQQAIQLISQRADETTEEERKEIYDNILKTLKDLNISAISSAIAGIKIPDGTLVTDKQEIIDFVDNSSVKLFKKIQKIIEDLRKEAEIDPIEVTCPDCEHKFSTPLIFDYAHFFE